jgi:hypothetical protein
LQFHDGGGVVGRGHRVCSGKPVSFYEDDTLSLIS